MIKGWALKEFYCLSIDTESNDWVQRLVPKICQTLKRLSLGIEREISGSYQFDGRFQQIVFDFQERQTEQIVQSMDHGCGREKPLEIQTLALDSLHLSGLNFKYFTGADHQFKVDYSVLKALRLESCIGLKAALTDLMSHKSPPLEGSLTKLANLASFTLRAENVSTGMMQDLRDFLTTLRPLKKLHLLLEGNFNHDIMEEVLKQHGEALRSLLWEERKQSRSTNKAVDKRADNGDVRLVSKYCIRLEALSIGVCWQYPSKYWLGDDVTFPPPVSFLEAHMLIPQFFESLASLENLETLSIRSLPDLPPENNWFTNDRVFKGVADSMIEGLDREVKKPLRLRTIAFGAPTYGNTHIGTYYHRNHHLADFLRLRIYHLQYAESLVTRAPFYSARLVATGVPDGAKGWCNHVDLFELYWLDGLPRDTVDRID